MSALPVPRQEAFARALAMDLSPGEASAEAGYARHWKHTRERAARPEIVARATALREALRRVEAAARGLQAEAAKRKARIEDRAGPPAMDAVDRARFMPLSDEDWLARYGHRA